MAGEDRVKKDVVVLAQLSCGRRVAKENTVTVVTCRTRVTLKIEGCGRSERAWEEPLGTVGPPLMDRMAIALAVSRASRVTLVVHCAEYLRPMQLRFKQTTVAPSSTRHRQGTGSGVHGVLSTVRRRRKRTGEDTREGKAREGVCPMS